MAEFRMPSLGADMERGTVVEWRVAPGDHVRRGDIVAVVDTEKADIEVEIFEDGVIDSIVVPVGEEVEVGAVLATLRGGTEAAPPVPSAPLVAAVAVTGSHAAAVTRSPLVRHRAEVLGVDLDRVAGTGPGGLVTRADVERAAATPVRHRASPRARRLAHDAGVDLGVVPGSGPGGAVVAADLPEHRPPSRAANAQAAVGALMARSKREIPHYYLGEHVDLSRAVAWLAERNRGVEVVDRILPAALLLRVVALAAAEVSEVNGWWRDGAFQPASRVDLGVAVARRGGGLVAPTLVGASDLPLAELMRALTDVVARAKAGRLRGSEMGEPSLTVTSLGDGGADVVWPVIYPPQVAMVGIGRIAERPWAERGMLGIRTTAHVSLAGDHRASNGHDGSRFLRALTRLLEDPEVL